MTGDLVILNDRFIEKIKGSFDSVAIADLLLEQYDVRFEDIALRGPKDETINSKD